MKKISTNNSNLTSNLITATASASDCACHGSRRLPRSDAAEPRIKFHKESDALPRGDGCDKRPEIATDVPLSFRRQPGPPARNAPQDADECCHTMPALLANPHLPLASKRPGASLFLKQSRLDLLPRDYIGRVLLVPSDSVIKLVPLRIRQRYRVRFQALPDRVQQLCLFGRREAVNLASQMVHTPTVSRVAYPAVSFPLQAQSHIESDRSAGLRDAGTHQATTEDANFFDFHMKLPIEMQAMSRIKFFRALAMPELPNKKDYDRIYHYAEDRN